MACTFIFLFRKNQNAPPLLGVINVICACQCVNIGFVGLTVFRIIYILEKCSRTFKWTRLKKWTVHNKLSRVAFLHVSPSGEEQTVVVETHQCEYLLSAIIQIVKELQVVNPSESFFYSSMISTNEEGSTSYENVLYSGPCDGVDDEGR